MLGKKVLVTGLAVGMATIILCGCSNLLSPESAAAAEAENTLSVNKEGVVTSTMIESFQEQYYQQDELQNMILTEAAAYNNQNGENSIGVEKVQAENGKINVIMRFSDQEHYARYKDTVFFVGTIAEAREQDFDMPESCHDIDDENQMIDRAQIEEMDKSYILITDEPIALPSVLGDESEFQPLTIETFGKIAYVSGGVVKGKNKNSVRIEAETEGLSYIIFK